MAARTQPGRWRRLAARALRAAGAAAAACAVALAVASAAPPAARAAALAARGPDGERPALVVHDRGAEWRETAKLRSSTSLGIHLAREAAVVAFLLWLWLSGRAAALRERVASRVGRRFLVDAAVVVAVYAAIRAVSLPFDVTRFALSRWFGVAHLPVASWLGDYAIQFAVNLASALFLALLFYAVVRRRPRTWWRWVAVAAVPFAVLSVAASPLYMSLFNTFTPLADRPLAGEILELAARSGVPAGEVYVVDYSRQTRAANAFVTGIGPTATIALSDTLLEQFSDEEILFVMAHEMGHYVHDHLWLGIAAAGLLTAFGAWLLQRLLAAVVARRGARARVAGLGDVASLPLVVAAVSLLGFAAQPVAASISRAIEQRADRFALELTVPGDVSPEAAVSTFERLGRLALLDPDPNPVLRFLFWSHPPLDERIAAIEAYRRRAGAAAQPPAPRAGGAETPAAVP